MSRYFRMWADELSDSSDEDILDLPHLSFDRALTLTASEVADSTREAHTYLDCAQRRLAREKDKFADVMKKLWDSLQLEKRLWNSRERLASSLYLSDSEIIELDVGGQRQITTSIPTLRKFPDSVLAAMFSGRHPIQKHKGKAFVDRDPEAFSHMISFLQTGRLPRDLSPAEELSFRGELDFWGIPTEFLSEPSPSRCEFDPSWCAPTLALENENRTVRKLGEFHGIVFTTTPINSQIDFKVTLDSENKYRMFLGLVDRRVYQPRFLVSLLWKEAPSSFYWDILNSKLIRTDEGGQHRCVKDYGCLCESQDGVFGVRYDAEKRWVEFYKGKVSQGVAFTDVPEGLYPAIDIWFASGTVAIL